MPDRPIPSRVRRCIARSPSGVLTGDSSSALLLGAPPSTCSTRSLPAFDVRRAYGFASGRRPAIQKCCGFSASTQVRRRYDPGKHERVEMR
jgi:hypothetical protein